MTKQETIQVFQSIEDRAIDFPNMTECDWVAIAAAKRHLTEKPVSEDLEKASKEWLSPQLDKSYANYGETKMMELTRFDGYAMLDAIEFGAKWQKQQDQETVELAEDHAMLAGMEKMKEQMIKDAVEIAREKELEYIKYQLDLRLPETLDYNGVKVNRKDFINDFIKAMKDG